MRPSGDLVPPDDRPATALGNGRTVRRPRRPGEWVAGPAIALAALGGLGLLAWLILSKGLFGFLREPTGWDIAFSVLPYSPADPYWWALLVGLSNTILAGSAGIAIATCVGFFVGLGRLSGNGLVADLAAGYVNVVRNIPVVLQAMFWYALVLHFPPVRTAHEAFGAVFVSNRGLFVPWFQGGGAALAIFVAGLALAVGLVLLGVRLLRGARWPEHAGELSIAALVVGASGLCLLVGVVAWPRALALDWPVRAGLNFRGGIRLPPELVALVAAIAVYRSAFIAEIFRAGLTAVSRGQIDAANSLGLPRLVTLLRIRVPLALVSIMPPLGSEFIIIMKITSIGIIVGFMDLFAVSSMTTMMTGRAVQVVLVMTVIYLVLNYTIALSVNAINARLQIKGTSSG